MTKNLHQHIEETTISLEEFSKNFTPEQNKIVEDEMKFYDVLIALKKMRKQIGLTQEQLAQKAKLPRTTVTKIESGKYNPTLSTLMSLANAMNKRLQVQVI